MRAHQIIALVVASAQAGSGDHCDGALSQCDDVITSDGVTLLQQRKKSKGTMACLCEAAAAHSEGEGEQLQERASLGGKNPHFNVTWVVVSAGMPEMLKVGMDCNMHLMHRAVVIADEKDDPTLRVCQDLRASNPNVECRATKALHLYGDPFNKGRALMEVQTREHKMADANDGQAILLMDHDVCLPTDIWDRVPSDLQAKTLYSTNTRCIYPTPEDARRGTPTRQEHYPSMPSLGFFQLYRAATDSPVYTDKWSGADESDLIFSREFGKRINTLPLSLNHMGEPFRDWQGHKGGSAAWDSVRLPAKEACPCCVPEEG